MVSCPLVICSWPVAVRMEPLLFSVRLAWPPREEKEVVAARCRNAAYLTARLRDLSGLSLPESSLERPHAYTYYPVVLRDASRYRFGERLAAAGIETKWRYHPLQLNGQAMEVDTQITVNFTLGG